MDAAALVDQKLAELSAADRQIIADNYQLLSNITSAGGNGYGATLVYFGRHVSRITHILQQIENVYVQTYDVGGRAIQETRPGFQTGKLLHVRSQARASCKIISC